MPEEKEENLLTIFKQIAEEAKKTRETMEELSYEAKLTSGTTLAFFSEIIYTSYMDLQELKKLFQWYAEKQTGKKYIKG